MQTENEVEQLSMFAQDGCCGKMSPAHSAAQMGKISSPSFKKRWPWQMIPCQWLDLRPGFGNLLGPYWDLRSPCPGESSMPNFSESPKDAAACSLSRILLDTVPPKYYLSQKACLGILRRAQCHGKELPPQLEQALRIQAGMPEQGVPAQDEQLCLNDQGGQRMDMSYGVTGTLRASMECHAPIIMGSQQGHASVTEDIAPAITAAAGMSGNNQPLLFENHSMDSRYRGPLDIAPTLHAAYGEGGNNISLCLSGNIFNREDKNGGNGMGIQDGIAYTLTATDRHAVFSYQRTDELAENEVTSTQAARQYKSPTDLVMDVAGLDCRNSRENGDISGSLQLGTSGTSLNSIHPVRIGQLIRRLVPLECERLQGYPDGWTDIPSASDAARYKALGNSVAVPCVEYILRGFVEYMNLKEGEEYADDSNV